MSRSKRGVPDFAKMRRALFAGLLGLGLATLWTGVVLATTVTGSVIGPEVLIDSVTDDGGGRIRVSWSLEAEPPEGYSFVNSQPDKVCVGWSVVENGVRGSATETCFTSEVSSQSDLLVDTGIGADGPTTVYSVALAFYYGNIFLLSKQEGGGIRRIEVTLNASS